MMESIKAQFLGDLLENTARLFPDKPAIHFAGTSWTWQEFDDQVTYLACALLSAGVEGGDRVAIMCSTRPEFLCIYMAAARIGAVLVGFNVQFTPAEVARLADLTRPKIMFILDEIRDRQVALPIVPVLQNLNTIKHVVVIGAQECAGTSRLAEWLLPPDAHLRQRLMERKVQLQPDDSALIVLTSGSTGVPKGAVLTHRSILATTNAQVREFDVQAQDRILQNKPMSHVGGSINLTLPAVAVGAELFFMDHFHPIRALEMVQEQRITILAQVPTMFIMEFNLPDFEQYDLSSVRLAVVGGAATPVPIMKRITQIADHVITGFGMTETGGYITFTRRDDDPDTIARTVGQIAPEFELRVVDEHRQPLPIGQVGEIALRGNCLLSEYFHNPAATAEAFSTDGWFFTGDVGYLDERHYLTLVDRRKDMYISGGYNVYPREIELYLAHHPELELVAILGVADPIMGEIGAACMVRRSGSHVSHQDIVEYCRQGLAEYKIPRQLFFLDEMPLTPLGKIDKPRLRRELFANG
jgi:fatty-acyl-CoA synthase